MKTLLLLLLTAAHALRADEPPAKPVPAAFRVTGLFSAVRVDDLRATLQKLPGIELVSVDFEHAEATFAFDPTVTFKGTKPENVRSAFDAKLRSASNSTFGIQPLFSTPREKLTRVEIPVAGLDCKACSLVAYEAIFKIDGVAQVTVSFRDGLVTALIDPQKTNRAALETALKNQKVTLKQP